MYNDYDNDDYEKYLKSRELKKNFIKGLIGTIIVYTIAFLL